MKYQVFIDTCIYKSMKYLFDSNNSLTMDLLKSEIDLNHIEILMPIIIKNEIISHLTPDKELIYSNIKNAIKNATKEYPWMINENYEMNISSCIKEDPLNNFKNFIKKYKCKILPYSYINIEKVFNKYFSNSYPFKGNNKKKYEFPDAFAIDIVKNYLNNNLDNLIVITTDESVKKSFPSKVPVLSSINELLNFLNSKKECVNDLKLHLKRIEIKKEEEILSLIQQEADTYQIEFSNIPEIDQNKKANIFISHINSYNLIGQKKILYTYPLMLIILLN